MKQFTDMALRAPKFTIWMAVAAAMLIVGLVLAPTLSSSVAQVLNPFSIDADPENMLFADDPVRIVHHQKKKQFTLYDLVVVGVVNEGHEEGVFNTETLSNIHDLTKFAENLQWLDDDGVTQGIVPIDIIAPSVIDNIEQEGLGAVRFDWLMEGPPKTQAEALEVRARARSQPLLNGSVVSDDGKGIALYFPLTSKSVSYQVVQMLEERIATYDSGDAFHISGLPIAQDQFAVEMFIQMAISSPLAMGLIFALMWYFFRNLTLIAAPMIVAMISTTVTMGLLIISGNSVHIMSSMIPIFIMPVAVLDAIHILSDFYDRYPLYKDRKETIRHVMRELSKPMLFTSLTTAVGFASLNFTPLPPIQLFGTFVAIGVLVAWLLTITIVPAYIALMPEKKFENFGMKREGGIATMHQSKLAKALKSFGAGAYKNAIFILVFVAGIAAVSGYGISKIVPNDNPVKWFAEEHQLRKSDKVLNEMFAGSYMAYLALSVDNNDNSLPGFAKTLSDKFTTHDLPQIQSLAAIALGAGSSAGSPSELLDHLTLTAESQVEKADNASVTAWNAALDYIDERRAELQVFKDPAVLTYIAGLQSYMAETGLVGKSNSVVEIIKTVHRELFLGNETEYRLPDTAAGVAQTLITFQNSHRPDDLWHYVTPDYENANIWLQLKTGDNQEMSVLEDRVEQYFNDNPAPVSLKTDWFGLTYVNVTWQDQMVVGMAKALLSSFIVVALMMMFLYRSILWGLLAMVPLTFSVAVLYGVVGLFGFDYNASIAILSALSLGLSIDYAIHFLTRARNLQPVHGSWKDTISAVFGEPARAITRNVVVVGAGFLPLLLAPLVPYQTVGVSISSILVFAGFATLTILPALMKLLEKWLFAGNTALPQNTDQVVEQER